MGLSSLILSTAFNIGETPRRTVAQVIKMIAMACMIVTVRTPRRSLRISAVDLSCTLRVLSSSFERLCLMSARILSSLR